MSSDDQPRNTVIHHIGYARPGNHRPAGIYGLRLGGRPDGAPVEGTAPGTADTGSDED